MVCSILTPRVASLKADRTRLIFWCWRSLQMQMMGTLLFLMRRMSSWMPPLSDPPMPSTSSMITSCFRNPPVLAPPLPPPNDSTWFVATAATTTTPTQKTDLDSTQERQVARSTVAKAKLAQEMLSFVRFGPNWFPNKPGNTQLLLRTTRKQHTSNKRVGGGHVNYFEGYRVNYVHYEPPLDHCLPKTFGPRQLFSFVSHFCCKPLRCRSKI